MSEPVLMDRFARKVDYLRMSVTDRCDFRCVYCMAEEMTFLPRQQILSLEEILQVAERFVALGTRKIRLTGGEPLVRAGVVGLCEKIAALPGLRELCMTTNGSQLDKLAAPLFKAGVTRLNISLDSLDPQRFRELTRTGDLHKVIAGIDAANAAGFVHTKLNCVVMHGRNDDEINDLLAFAIDRNLDVSFIEEMPLGIISEHSRAESSTPAIRCANALPNVTRWCLPLTRLRGHRATGVWLRRRAFASASSPRTAITSAAPVTACA